MIDKVVRKQEGLWTVGAFDDRRALMHLQIMHGFQPPVQGREIYDILADWTRSFIDDVVVNMFPYAVERIVRKWHAIIAGIVAQEAHINDVLSAEGRRVHDRLVDIVHGIVYCPSLD